MLFQTRQLTHTKSIGGLTNGRYGHFNNRFCLHGNCNHYVRRNIMEEVILIGAIIFAAIVATGVSIV